ncbi:MAG: tetratricopeptide repeat protein, partial [Phycisphaerales bacterium]|nr:tetratricopeptide repeat protein [Phycisphaerales bacterium]
MARRHTPSRKPTKPDRHAEAIKRAMARFNKGDRKGCLDALHRVLAADPKHAQAHRITAFIHHDARDHERARYHAEKAVALNPGGSQPRTMLGVVLDALGETDAALDSMRRAVELNPHDPDAWTTLGLTLDALDRFDESIEAHRRALGVNPDHATAAMNLSLSLLSMGKACEAVDLVRRLAHARPDDTHVAERLAFCLNYDDRATRADINAAHRAWGRLAEAARPVMPTRLIEPGRPLRVGFISPDFRRHSVAYFLRPVLEHLDRDRFEVHALFTSTRSD